MTYKYILKLKITYRLFVIVNILTQLINIAILLVKISDRRFWNSACVSFSNKFIPQKRSAPLRVHKKPFWRWLSSWCKIQKVARRKVKLRFPNTLWTVVLASWVSTSCYSNQIEFFFSLEYGGIHLLYFPFLWPNHNNTQSNLTHKTILLVQYIKIK